MHFENGKNVLGRIEGLCYQIQVSHGETKIRIRNIQRRLRDRVKHL